MRVFPLASSLVTALLCSTTVVGRSVPHKRNDDLGGKDASVLILGGGVAGVIAARTLHNQGITSFKIVEARDEIGGRLKSHKFGAPGRELTVELGANWVQGIQSGTGPEVRSLTCSFLFLFLSRAT
jgi:phytoene dehydrogenase-like protein